MRRHEAVVEGRHLGWCNRSQPMVQSAENRLNQVWERCALHSLPVSPEKSQPLPYSPCFPKCPLFTRPAPHSSSNSSSGQGEPPQPPPWNNPHSPSATLAPLGTSRTSSGMRASSPLKRGISLPLTCSHFYFTLCFQAPPVCIVAALQHYRLGHNTHFPY